MMSSAYPRSRRVSLRRKALLISSATLAIATAALAPQKAKAQAFQGNPDPTSGIVTFDRNTPGVETITIGSQNATIFWAPTDTQGIGNIDFLPVNNTATFTNGQAIDNYTVLNRIVPTDPSRTIELNGTIESFVNGSTGGNIWFFSPGGILVGSQAAIDVGSLLLTTLDPGSGWSADGSGFSASFAPYGQTAPGSVVVNAGASISALEQNSYIALVAPRVEQHGNVQVNGSAAYVAGESLTMTMNLGLFDIQMDRFMGTDDAHGIVHTGTTAGPSSTGAGDNHRVYIAAVPKNQALTMLLSGNVGFEAATVAGVENGQIVLSSGWTPNETEFGLNFSSWVDVTTGGISITGGNFTSDVRGLSQMETTVTTSTGSVSFAGDVWLDGTELIMSAFDGRTITVGGKAWLWAENDATLIAGSGGVVDIAGDAWLWAPSGAEAQVAVIATGGGSVDIGGNLLMLTNGSDAADVGDALIIADGGNVNVAGVANIDVNGGYFAAATTDSFAGDGYGGDIGIYAYNSGAITTGGLQLSAHGTGQDGVGGASDSAGRGYGGYINIYADSGAAITVNGNLNAHADGYGGDMLDGSTAGGAGYGGSIWLAVYDGSIDVTGFVNLSANGIGGSYFGEGIPAVAQGGLGQGGFVEIWSGGPGSIAIGGTASLMSWGMGGNGQTGGDGYGGSAGIAGIGGTITLGPDTHISALGVGGHANVGIGGYGGYGQGGTAYIEAWWEPGNIEVPSSTGTIIGGNATLDVSGVGGDGGAGNGDNIAAGNGGTGQGGAFQGESFTGGAFAAAASPASLTLGHTTLVSNGQGGLGGTGGAGQVGGLGGSGFGGSAQAGNYAGDGLNGATASYGTLILAANGHGGDGGSGGGGQGDGGEAWGGSVFVNAKGAVTADWLEMYAEGFGGDGANGGDAWGGYTVLHAFEGATIDVLGDARLHVSATGGTGSTGYGGDAWGGNGTEVQVDGVRADPNSIITVGGELLVYANAFGGGGVTGGNAWGGYAYTQATGGGSISSDRLLLEAAAFGGAGAETGGTAFGGTATLYIDGGDVAVGSMSTDPFHPAMLISAYARGGTGAAGGDAFGGLAEILVWGVGSSLDVAGFGVLLANGDGGNGSDNSGGSGGDGGDGFGGDTYVDVAAGTVTLGDTEALAIGRGGHGGSGATGGSGGDGYGGFADTTIAGSLTADSYFAFARAFGGNGGIGTSSSGNGGQAESGAAITDVLSGATVNVTGTFGVNSSAFGGIGANGGDAFGGVSTMSIAGNVTAGSTQVTAAGFGGEGTSGAGGDGYGGIAGLYVNGSLATQSGFMGNGGYGGNGVTSGGNGDAGEVTVFVDGGSVSVAGDFLIESRSTGGHATGGQGGSAFGGYAIFEVYNGGSLTGGSLTMTTNGVGGDGSTGGGQGYGGDSALRSHDGGVTELTQSLTITAAGAGGNSANGTGGDGYGGYARMSTYAEETGGTIVADNATVDSSGTGGNGVNGGNGYGRPSSEGWGGSVVQSIATGSSITLTGETIVRSNGTGGNGTTGAGGDGEGGYASIAGVNAPLTFEDALVQANGSRGTGGGGNGTGTGGVATVRAHDNGSVTGGDAFVSALGSTQGGLVELLAWTGGDVQFNSVTAVADSGLSAGEVLVSVQAGSVADLGNAYLSAMGGPGGSVQAYANGGDVLASNLSLLSSGDIQVLLENGGNVDVAGTLFGTAGGIVALDDIGGGAVHANVLELDAFNISNGADLAVNNLLFNVIADFNTGDLSVAGSMGIFTAGSLTAGNLSAGTTIDLAAGGDLAVSNVDAVGSATFTAGNLASFLGIVSAPSVIVTSADISVALEGSLGVLGVTNLLILNATSDSVVIGGTEGSTATGEYHLSEQGEIAAANIVVNAVGTSSSSAPEVRVLDVLIEGSQTAGGGTSSVTLNTAGSVFVEGDVQYVNAGAGDALAINAGEIIGVVTDTGSITMTDSNGDLSGNLFLTAHDIWVADQSVIDQLLVDPNFPGLEEALAINNGADNQAGYVQAGAITATMLGSSLLVQNTGTSQSPAGLSVGDEGLTIVNNGAEPATVILYGRQVQSDGTIVSGDAFAEEIAVAGPGGVTTDSTVNGCPIGGCAPPPPPVDPPPVDPPPVDPPPVDPPPVDPPPVDPPPTPPVQEVLNSDSILGPVGGSTNEEQTEQNEEEEEEEGEGETSVDPSVQLINTGPMQTNTTVDEPVTSGTDGPGGMN